MKRSCVAPGLRHKSEKTSCLVQDYVLYIYTYVYIVAYVDMHICVSYIYAYHHQPQC